MKRNIRIVILTLLTIVLSICGTGVNANASDITSRLAGDDRCGTAIEISKSGWMQSANVILATGDDYPDALCAAPLAKQLNAPILLNGKLTLDKRVEAEIKRLGSGNVYIIGGYGVISKDIEDKLKESKINIVRLYGNDRYETSIEVAKYSGVSFGSEIVIATGDDFPDALSIAPIAAKKGMPIILSQKASLPDVVKKFIKEKSITKTYVIGGQGVIAESLLAELPNPKRISGNDRYLTNKAVFDAFPGDVFYDTVYFSTGNDYPDALSGSALALRTSSPIVLVDEVSKEMVKAYVQSKFSLIKKVVALGGEGAILSSTLEYVIPKVVIASIGDISASTFQGKSYVLPEKVSAVMSNNITEEFAVTWNPLTADNSKAGTYTYIGTVKDYSKKVTLTLTVNVLNSIMGTSEVTPENMVKFLFNVNLTPKLINVTALELAKMFIEEGNIEGVRGDVAFCQSIHETGYFSYGGQVLPEQNNYAGIGATNNSPVGKGGWFANPREGVRAQIQHLKAYASREPLKQQCVDPRYDILVKYNLIGIAPNWEDLNGRWAVPGTTYGQSIMALFEKLKGIK